jgi:hypothetical protein
MNRSRLDQLEAKTEDLIIDLQAEIDKGSSSDLTRMKILAMQVHRHVKMIFTETTKEGARHSRA